MATTIDELSKAVLDQVMKNDAAIREVLGVAVPKFQPGHQVMLRSGGPSLTVLYRADRTAKYTGEAIYCCRWWSGSQFDHSEFSESSITADWRMKSCVRPT